ncbi:MAG: phage major capsid protein, partial [Deltaproteobacteria bacterium]
REVIAEQIGYELDQEILEGDGTNLTGLNATSGVNTVDAGGSTATNGAAVRFQDLALALYKAQHASTRNNAAWFMHPDIAATIVGMVDSNNQPVFHFGGADRTPTEMILGRPLYTVPALSRTQTKGTSTDCSTIYFGPWRKGLFGIRRQLTFEVTNQASFTTDEVDFRMIGRFDCAFPVPSAFTKITGCRVV